jgi:phenylalanyl-tRNA synthetase beta chain
MRVSMKWLNELVAVDLPIPEFVSKLDMTGTAVEAVHTTGEALSGVVVGLIAEKTKHPEADKLWVTTVDVGDGSPRQIVCGAQNFEAGDKVPVALVGAVLPGGFEIKKAKLRGVVSEGMNCSARELGLGEDHDGLLILPPDAPVGMPFAEYKGMSDTVIELEVTPNRPDCLSMIGVAREVGAILDRPWSTVAQSPEESGQPVADQCIVEIADADLCSRYAARIIKGVKIGPSPQWLAERITAAGARPINNVVDVTNYVMFELGQPLHAFDLATIAADAQGRAAITVRTASEGEVLTTLDGVERMLRADTLLICDPSGPIALAGVMGGEDTEVSDATVDVLLESACFDPATTSRTSRSLGLVSEASMRFERTVDRTQCVAALDRAAALIAECSGGTVCPGVIDEFPSPKAPATLTLRASRLVAILGIELPADEVAGILVRLGCDVESHADRFEVTVPAFRPDLEREIDLVEEVLRVWGMERVAATLPASREKVGGLTPEQSWRERIGVTLRAAGLNETMTYAFADPTDIERCDMALADDELLVELLNPMSIEQAVLRRSLLPGLVRAVSLNQRRGVADVHLYEIGTVFWTAENRKQPKERAMIAGVLAGSWGAQAWNTRPVPLDFFDGKGIVESLARELAVDRFKVRAAEIVWLQPGRAAEVLIGGEVVGWLGEVHPAVLERFEASGAVVAFELDAARLIRAAKKARPFVDLPRFPAVEHDIAIVVDEAVTAERIEQALRSAGGKLLESVRLFDVYRGTGVATGKKSMAFALSYRAPDRTLTAEEVDSAHEKLVRKALGAVGGELRG